VRDERIVGLTSPRSGLWRESRETPDLLIDAFVEARLVLCRDVDLLNTVLSRLKRHRASAAIVVNGDRPPRINHVVGVITKRAIADTVIDNFAD
jgi:CIC family chloride channel protein